MDFRGLSIAIAAARRVDASQLIVRRIRATLRHTEWENHGFASEQKGERQDGVRDVQLAVVVRVSSIETSRCGVSGEQIVQHTNGVHPTSAAHRIIASSARRSVFPNPEMEVVFHRGDPDSNKVVNVRDVVTIVRYLFVRSRESDCVEAADVNDDGRVRVDDAVGLLLWLFDHCGDRVPAPAVPDPPRHPCGTDRKISPRFLGCSFYDAC